MDGLVARGVFRIFKRQDAEPNPNILPTRMVRGIKHMLNGVQQKKSRLVLGGHRDKQKRMIVHSVKYDKAKVISCHPAIATILGSDIWSS